jgi:hypothetical protein
MLLALCATVAENATEDKGLATLIPAGALLVSRGVLMLRYPDSVLEPLARREDRGISGRTGLRIEHRFGAVLFLIIGLGWAVLGVMYGT